MAKLGKKKKKKKKKILSASEKTQLKAQKAQVREVRSVFGLIGFKRVAGVGKLEFTYQETTSDFDDAFIHDNVLVFVEYTTLKEASLSEHLKKKKILYDKILGKPSNFIEFLDTKIPDFTAQRGTFFSVDQYKVILVYCSLHNVKPTLKLEVPGPKYFDYPVVQYFRAVTRAVKASARFEFFKFLGLDYNDVGENIISPSSEAASVYEGSVLPEGHSHFGKGFKVVSFYVDPESLLSRCYVLRKDGWEETSSLYQRMISRSKIEAIRKYLLREKRVFINNIIVTMPSNTKLLSSSGNPLDISTITKTTPARIQLPTLYNSIGLIDGQHRVFSYYEGGASETEIRKLRKQQNLLVTGIIYPSNISATSKTKFEATLFLEINANQTNAKSELKQAIGLLLRPFSQESIAKEVVNRLNNEGPLADQFERYFFDKGKIKTTSVVSYGIRPIVKFQGTDTLFKTWNNPQKEKLSEETDGELLYLYIEYCVTQINTLIGAFKANLPSEKWTTNKDVPGRMLTTTNVNGLVVCLRRLVENNKVHSFEYYNKRLGEVSKFNFGKYRSSQYGSMGEELYKKYFE